LALKSGAQKSGTQKNESKLAQTLTDLSSNAANHETYMQDCRNP
jgi:hypothetical protein